MEVALTEACYTFHILVEHPDLSDTNEIAQTIKRPDYITEDVIDDERLVYYRTYRRRPQRWMLKVVVEENEVVTAYRVKRLKKGDFPNTVEPSQLWVNYSPKADSLTIYFTSQPVPSVWDDIDQYAYIGFALDDETSVTGIMIEHFSKWLFVSNLSKSKVKSEYKPIRQKIAA
jgi:hypothetical protein